jgi:type I restriction enzyme S subunit
MITARDINRGRIQFDTARCTTEIAYRTLLTAKSRPKSGDLLLTKDGTLGRLAVVDERRVCINQSVAIIRPNLKAVSQFLKLLLESPAYQARMLEDAGGSTIKHIYITIVNRMPVAVPPTKAEQHAIAEALTDANALIDLLETVIAKKRAIKQGAMQDLLTARRRLPGFKEEWSEQLLGMIAPLQRGFDLPNSRLSEGPYPVVYSNGILNHHSQFQVKGPGVVTGRSGTLGAVTYVDDNYWPHNTTLWVTSFGRNDPKFIGFLYSWIGFERFASGSGVPTLNRNDAHAFKVRIPPSSDEQKAIAGVLQDIDADISELEKRLAQAQHIKQGMMQELLTGKVRLA